MDMCKYLPTAIRITRRTISMIQALDPSVVLEGNEDNYFMIYCHGSDHEELEVIDKATYDRTYEPLPDHVDAMQVTTID